ncbi:MAG: hypothetical protein LBV26_02125 [Bacteroidales bacterium]|nr:hypothetical protein [Bacteroidales bacterium]
MIRLLQEMELPYPVRHCEREVRSGKQSRKDIPLDCFVVPPRNDELSFPSLRTQ